MLPHTSIVEAKARRVIDHPPTGLVPVTGLADQTAKSDLGRYAKNAKRVEDLRRADPYVIGHDFHITFWADQGAVRDPVDLDAALRFVRSRYDLNLGLWDLARDPLLRTTLLRREEIEQPTRLRTSAPAELVTMAKEKVDERQEEEETQRTGQRSHHQAIWPTLAKLGFEIPSWKQREGVDYRFGVGPLIRTEYSRQDEPALSLFLGIWKRQAVVSLFETAGREGIVDFLRANSAVIEGITGRSPEPEKWVVWRIEGKGWAGSTEDWPQYLKKLELLVAQLAPRLRPVGEAAAAAHAKNRELYGMDGQPAAGLHRLSRETITVEPSARLRGT